MGLFSDCRLAAWNLMNEPRNEHTNSTAEMQAWLTTMAAHVKQLAPNQLITIGQDGFYGKANCMSERYATSRSASHKAKLSHPEPPSPGHPALQCIIAMHLRKQGTSGCLTDARVRLSDAATQAMPGMHAE